MIDFRSDQLLKLARTKYASQHFEEALDIICRAPVSVETLNLENQIRYSLGKKSSSEGDFHSALEHFKACSGSTVDIELRVLAQERCKLLNALSAKDVKSVNDIAGVHADAKIKSTMKLPSKCLAPAIWFVGAAAAYRSGYDLQSNDNLSRLIRLIKHDADDKTLVRLGELLADFIFSNTPILAHADYVVPVPTSPDRWNERGYRIPNRLAQVVSSLCALPIFTDVLETVGELPELRRLPRWYRSKAIQGAYKATKNQKIQGYSLIIIDDIITTGSTVTEIAHTLLSAGARAIAAISLGHTERSE